MREAGAMTEFDRSAGSLCLDFVATVRDWPERRIELLGTPAELTGWFETAGLPVAAGGLTEQDLLDARTLRAAVAEPDTAAALSVIARDAINLLAGPALGRIRACDSDGCATLFYDRSPSGRRRWCSMRRCGEKVAAANYRRRVAARSRP